MEQTTFTDSDGVAWHVREDGADDARPLSADSPSGATWLRFESELEVRRLWHYPDDWRGLSPIQLESLLDRASTVIARFRPAPHRGADRSTATNTAGLGSAEFHGQRRGDSATANPGKREDS